MRLASNISSFDPLTLTEYPFPLRVVFRQGLFVADESDGLLGPAYGYVDTPHFFGKPNRATRIGSS